MIVAETPVVKAAPAATLRLGQIGERLGFAVTANFLASLGFAPAQRERAAVLYRETDFPLMCAALVRHVRTVQAGQAEQAA